MKLGVIIPEVRANTYYRAILPMQALEKRGHSVVWAETMTQQAALRRLAACDLVHCYRRPDRLADLESLARRGVAISFDNDDDFGATDMVEGKSSLHGRLTNRRSSAIFDRMARCADLVTTPSEQLATKYRRAGAKRVAVIENHLDPSMPCFGYRSQHDGVVVGWVAGIEHAVDVPGLKIAENLSRLLDAHASLRVLTVGVRLPIESGRYEHIPEVAHRDLFKVISRMDIGIAPLRDSEFNRARSNVKLKEYGAGGVAWMASPVGPYRELGEKQGGVLVADDDWLEALDQLVRKRVMRSRLGRRALRWAKTQTVDRHAADWEQEFLLAIETIAQRDRSAAT